FHELGRRAYRAIQAPTRTARPTATLTHMVRSALWVMFWSAKNLSRRRRKTLGKEDAPTGSVIDAAEDSDGTRSGVSGSWVINTSDSNVTSTSAVMLIGPDPFHTPHPEC